MLADRHFGSSVGAQALVGLELAAIPKIPFPRIDDCSAHFAIAYRKPVRLSEARLAGLAELGPLEFLPSLRL